MTLQTAESEQKSPPQSCALHAFPPIFLIVPIYTNIVHFRIIHLRHRLHLYILNLLDLRPALGVIILITVSLFFLSEANASYQTVKCRAEQKLYYVLSAL